MYNVNDIQFVGKHDYDKQSAERIISMNYATFSVNIFQWKRMKTQRKMKRSKCVVRVYGTPENKEKVFRMCESIVEYLDNGIWDGGKVVIVK